MPRVGRKRSRLSDDREEWLLSSGALPSWIRVPCLGRWPLMHSSLSQDSYIRELHSSGCPFHLLFSIWFIMSFQVRQCPSASPNVQIKIITMVLELLQWSKMIMAAVSHLPTATSSNPGSGCVFAKPGWTGSVTWTAWLPPLSHPQAEG